MTRFIKALGIVLLFVLLLGIMGVIYLRSSLPKVSGSIELPSLTRSVEITRDTYGIPHIVAQSKEDALFALGFVHAQDRLWQMEFQRRLGAGRLAEVLGEPALNADRFLRTLGIYHYAEKTLENLDPEIQEGIDAYVSGINDYLQTRRGPLPLEFLLLRHTPEPFTTADVLVWGKMLAWNLGGNWDDELLRARLSLKLSQAQVAELWPPYPGDAPIILPEFGDLYESLDLATLWNLSPKPLPPGAGSNNWVVGGEKSISGKPLLANDPHLGLQTPSLWYFAHLSAPGLEVIGASLPGTPGILLGRTDRIAWGFTNANPDVQDLFIEKLQPGKPDHYQTPKGFEPFEIRQETIQVKGQDAIDLEVRESRHGPIISDAFDDAKVVAQTQGEDHVLAFAWTTLGEDDLTVQAVMKMNMAKDWFTFKEALRDFHAPQQNIVYADVEGNIAYYAPAKVPIRAKGNGLMPVPGWTAEYDWQGFIPFESLPQSFNPASGQILTANHKIVTDDYPYFLTRDWSEPYRAERISALLSRSQKHSLDSFAAIQADQTSLMIKEFLPVLRSIKTDSDFEREVQASLLAWDGSTSFNEQAPLVFAVWYQAFVRLMLEDELDELFEDYYDFRPLFVRSVLASETRNNWCDDVRTKAEESCAFIAKVAFKQSLAYLSDTLGANRQAWRWGKLHKAFAPHRVFTNTPLAFFFDLLLENGGDAFTVNVGHFDIAKSEDPFYQTHGPGLRTLFDLDNLSASRFIHNSGQSGNPLSRHYRDFFRRWRDVAYVPMTMDKEQIAKARWGVLLLEPSF